WSGLGERLVPGGSFLQIGGNMPPDGIQHPCHGRNPSQSSPSQAQQDWPKTGDNTVRISTPSSFAKADDCKCWMAYYGWGSRLAGITCEAIPLRLAAFPTARPWPRRT